MPPDPMPLPRLEPATKLEDLAATLRAKPLETPQELDAFYSGRVQQARGVNRMGELALALEDALRLGDPFKGLLTGHPGVGKTTEVHKLLLQDLRTTLRPIWLNVASNMNPASVRFYDILLRLAILLERETTSPTLSGFDDDHALTEKLDAVRDHLGKKWHKRLNRKVSEFKTGAKLPLNLLDTAIQSGKTDEAGQEDYLLEAVPELQTAFNDLLKESNRVLAKHQGQQWILVIDDFEKLGVRAETVIDLMTGLRPYLEKLEGHILLTVPVWFQFSEQAQLVMPAGFVDFILPDIAVYDRQKQPGAKALAALRDVVAERAHLTLFAEGVLDRLCLASGGNLRDLFAMIRNAMLAARLDRSPVIEARHIGGAIARLRDEYDQSLGSHDQDPEIDKKLTRLVQIYRREDSTAEIADPLLYRLLRQRHVLQYNGERWLGVHPVVVDLLKKYKALPEGAPGGTQP